MALHGAHYICCIVFSPSFFVFLDGANSQIIIWIAVSALIVLIAITGCLVLVTLCVWRERRKSINACTHGKVLVWCMAVVCGGLMHV